MIWWMIGLVMLLLGNYEPMTWIALGLAFVVSVVAVVAMSTSRDRKLAELDRQLAAGLLTPEDYKRQKQQLDAPCEAQPF
jgi:heme exporter protein D